MLTKDRSSDQIIVDALTVERSKVQKRLDKVKAELDATPWIDIHSIRVAASKLDLKTEAGRLELERLAKEEAIHLAIFRRVQRIDRVKLSTSCLSLTMEIQTITGLIDAHSGHIAIRKLCRDM